MVEFIGKYVVYPVYYMIGVFEGFIGGFYVVIKFKKFTGVSYFKYIDLHGRDAAYQKGMEILEFLMYEKA